MAKCDAGLFQVVAHIAEIHISRDISLNRQGVALIALGDASQHRNGMIANVADKARFLHLAAHHQTISVGVAFGLWQVVVCSQWSLLVGGIVTQIPTLIPNVLTGVVLVRTRQI